MCVRAFVCDFPLQPSPSCLALAASSRVRTATVCHSLPSVMTATTVATHRTSKDVVSSCCARVSFCAIGGMYAVLAGVFVC